MELLKMAKKEILEKIDEKYLKSFYKKKKKREYKNYY